MNIPLYDTAVPPGRRHLNAAQQLLMLPIFCSKPQMILLKELQLILLPVRQSNYEFNFWRRSNHDDQINIRAKSLLGKASFAFLLARCWLPLWINHWRRSPGREGEGRGWRRGEVKGGGKGIVRRWSLSSLNQFVVETHSSAPLRRCYATRVKNDNRDACPTSSTTLPRLFATVAEAAVRGGPSHSRRRPWRRCHGIRRLIADDDATCCAHSRWRNNPAYGRRRQIQVPTCASPVAFCGMPTAAPSRPLAAAEE